MVIPPQGRELVLQELHETHPGCARMKSLAWNYIWWPKMDSAIEDQRRSDTVELYYLKRPGHH